ncbi:MAG TPA: NADH-quinone oxidoreductase subunit I [Nitriliruptorales bacterium]|nr:NADH-quinone oxidoreductase subunit I [Nitriliruptorales bacterium]
MASRLPTLPKPKLPGLVKGLGVTLKTMLTPAVTRQYPHEKPDLAPRTRGVIALMEENCTVCMLCAKECPDWCIYIESHKERVPPAQEGGRERTRNQLDRFAIDFALCMYCGICVDVCPFDALFWSPEFEYSTYAIAELVHEKERLREWMDTVPPPPPLEEGAEQPPELSRVLEQAEQRRRAEEEAQRRAVQAAQQPRPGAPAGGGPAAVEEEIEVEAEVDEEVYRALIAEGKSERVARARAKAAFVRREKARILAERQAATEAPERPAATEAATDAAQQQVTASEVAQAVDAGPPPQEVEDVHVEAGEVDQETFDRLIAEGKPERVARARAKSAWVRKEKARLRAERDEDGQ